MPVPNHPHASPSCVGTSRAPAFASPWPRRSSWHPSPPPWRRRSRRAGPGRAARCPPAVRPPPPCGKSAGTAKGDVGVSSPSDLKAAATPSPPSYHQPSPAQPPSLPEWRPPRPPTSRKLSLLSRSSSTSLIMFFRPKCVCGAPSFSIISFSSIRSMKPSFPASYLWDGGTVLSHRHGARSGPSPPQRSLCVRPTRGAHGGGVARRQARAGNSKGTGTDDLGHLARPREAAGEPLTAPRSIIRDRFCFRVALGRRTPRDAAKSAAGSLGQELKHTLLLAATRANRPWREAHRVLLPPSPLPWP